MNPKPVLRDELRGLIESRMKSTLEGIEETLQRVLKDEGIGFEDSKQTLQDLEESFDLLSPKWNLQILYILLIRETTGFGELKDSGCKLPHII